MIRAGKRGRRHGIGTNADAGSRGAIALEDHRLEPRQLLLEFALWNRRAVMLAIKQFFGIDMPIRTVGEYLRRWGFTPQRPVKRALEQDRPASRRGSGTNIRRSWHAQRLRMPRSTGVTRPPFAKTRTGFRATRWQA